MQSNVSTDSDIYQAIFDHCQLGLIVTDAQQRIVAWNPWVAKFSGLKPDLVLGKLLPEVFPDLEGGSLQRAVKVALSHGMSSVISHSLNPNALPLFNSAGHPIDQQIKIKPIGDDKAKRRCLIQINDITSAVKRDRQLLDNVAELTYQKHVLDLHAIVGVTDAVGQFSYVNDLFCASSGYSREELLGQTPELLHSDAHPAEFFDSMRQTIQSGQVWKGDVCCRNKAGDRYWVSTTIVPDISASGTPSRYFMVSTDITERKRAEDAAHAAAIAKSQFLANMSHEIRTPMNAILGLTRRVMETELSQEQREQLLKVKKSAQALLRIINDVLDFSRFESSNLVLERVPVQLETALLEVSDLFGAQIAEKGLEIFVDIDPATPLCVLTDPLRLNQILSNLVGNAVKFTERGEIDIAVQPERLSDDAIVLRFSVRDTGIGLTSEQCRHLFTPFVQADSSITRKYGGSGLGLAIAKKLVELMDGNIELESRIGQGTSVTFCITAGIAPEASQFPNHYPKDLHKLKGKRVLIADDLASSRRILSRLLSNWGLETVLAGSGLEAISLVRDANRQGKPFYAALLDWRMPGLNGLDTAARLKAIGSETGPPSKLRVVIITAYDKHGMLQNPLMPHVDAVLTKPVMPSMLFDALLDAHAAQPAASQDEGTQHFAGLQVLLVEDHDINQELAASFLQKRGIDVTIACDGAEALAIVKQGHAFDLVLMDIHMPVMGGLEATQLIRELPQGRNLPIVAMTAAVLAEDRQQCLAAGMNDFIPKPVNPAELVRVLNAYTQTAPARSLPTAAPKVDRTILDVAQSLNRLDGDTFLRGRLMQGFIERYHEIDDQLAELLSKNLSSAAADLLHALKGVAANLGAVALAEQSGRMLETLRRGADHLDLTHFQSVLQETMRQMQAFIATDSTSPILPIPAAPTVETDEVMASIETYLKTHEVIPDQLLQALLDMADSDKAYAAAVQRLLYHIDNFDYPEALRTMAALKPYPENLP